MRYAEWETCENPRGSFISSVNPLCSNSRSGLVAFATAAYATLLAIPGRQVGHVQLIHLPPCSPPVPKGPPSPASQQKPPVSTKHPVAIIAAHTTALTTLSAPPSGRLIATTSSRGTLVRIWDSFTGKLVRELRRGTDKAEIFGVAFRPDEQEVCVWSDKGTVHVFTLVSSGPSSVSTCVSSFIDPFWLEIVSRLYRSWRHIYHFRNTLNPSGPMHSTGYQRNRHTYLYRHVHLVTNFQTKSVAL